ncbi:5-methyltetrahydropteroyltriglutamate--homocysteine S-methyltransferase [Asticcacaulis biprosthecium C19]|uniref:5-methyltetrahydropteroyltriglutamate--homocysteine methyltransferase n=1 Tax=Asticcacaulis biprosthecium C19 TaxID=715226 RepID=F4QT71_9CAUL|nr:5-methyltetrahydropteroyltriglutamate--homocysteine S-methyltransferase [Asticcacaulis biprosthecium]EGF89941.1 5-methyltetrahydropteroyltriglutamate--homocysteine S-methyltransferase [Asticcacaulis biprosthecium C19]
MSLNSLPVATLGTPRIGSKRELKFALESYWSGKTSQADLLQTAAELRAINWARQKARGVDIIPSNDFSLYDHVLDTSLMVGAIPAGYGEAADLDTYFAMARGAQTAQVCGHGHVHHHGLGVPAQEMTKWFDTNYHYLVPEFTSDQTFRLSAFKPLDEFLEAKSLGYHTRPVLVGPVTFLRLGKSPTADFNPLSLIDRLIPVYADILTRLCEAGADWVQIDEPVLALDHDAATAQALQTTYAALAEAVPDLKILVAGYFGGLDDNLDLALSLPIAGLHLDLIRAPEQLSAVLARAPAEWVLSLGVIDGRNIWRADLDSILDRLEPVVSRGHLQLAPSCSLLHVPIDLDLEDRLDLDVKSWLAFSLQKMEELKTLSNGLTRGRHTVHAELVAATSATEARKYSRKVHNDKVRTRLSAITPQASRRGSPVSDRAKVQRDRFRLPAFPTTTIGSFPQTAAVRQARSAYAKGDLTAAQYDTFLKAETERAIRWQEEIGLDVLVHGEFERNDMVQYFGEQLSGFAFTRHAWVQSYGSRCVRPPVLFGDVARAEPMTVAWWRYAQSLTDKPVKGMLTGPVTILNWSFVRDDLPRATVCRQIALAIRDEVASLEAAGARMIQIDEAALREGLPLRRRDWDSYLDWAVEAFRLTASGVTDATQIHTHMCYSEFNDILDAITAMDADVISIETSRSKMELLDAFAARSYPAEIGPGVYDIHAPRVPEVSEMVHLLALARQRLDDGQIWINPDCGLKTRGWAEVRPALVNMVAAAKKLRGRFDCV